MRQLYLWRGRNNDVTKRHSVLIKIISLAIKSADYEPKQKLPISVNAKFVTLMNISTYTLQAKNKL